jgi:hypothetical protein
MRPAGNIRELAAMLFEDLRIEEDDLRELNRDVILKLQEKYHTTNIKKLCTLMRRL